MRKQELRQIYARFFHPEKSPGSIDLLTGLKDYTGNENTIKKRFEKNRGVLIFNKGTFKGNIRRTFNLGN